MRISPPFCRQGQAVGSILCVTPSDTPKTRVGQNETGEAPMVSTVCYCIANQRHTKPLQQPKSQKRGHYRLGTVSSQCNCGFKIDLKVAPNLALSLSNLCSRISTVLINSSSAWYAYNLARSKHTIERFRNCNVSKKCSWLNICKQVKTNCQPNNTEWVRKKHEWITYFLLQRSLYVGNFNKTKCQVIIVCFRSVKYFQQFWVTDVLL